MIPRRVVLLHGFTQGGGIWVPVMESMTTRAAIEAPDLPGHGSCSNVRSRLDDSADDLAGRYGDSAWVGYSLGGRVALHVALRHPEKVSHLVLCSTTAGIEDENERVQRRNEDAALAARIRTIGVEAFLEEWTTRPLFAHLTRSAHDHEVRRENTAEGLASSLEIMGTGHQVPSWDTLHTLNMPVLIVTGSLDTKFTALGRRLVAAIGPNAKHVEVPDTGHAVPFERPLDFAAILSAFLR